MLLPANVGGHVREMGVFRELTLLGSPTVGQLRFEETIYFGPAARWWFGGWTPATVHCYGLSYASEEDRSRYASVCC